MRNPGTPHARRPMLLVRRPSIAEPPLDFRADPLVIVLAEIVPWQPWEDDDRRRPTGSVPVLSKQYNLVGSDVLQPGPPTQATRSSTS